MSVISKPDVDVAIVGGGPVGLCLALLLTRRGHTVLVTEAEAEVSLDLRASTFHPPTLDMLEDIGITEGLLAKGLVCPHWQIRSHPDGRRAIFDMSVLADETGHPYRLQCEQWKLSLLLLDAVKAEGGATVRFGARASTVEQDEAGATLGLEGPNGEPLGTVRARFLVGADGARSIVRKALDLPFEGITYPETTLLATTTFPFEAHLEGLSNVTYCWKPGGNFSLLKVPGRWRVSIYPDETRPIEEQLEPEALQAALQEIVPNPSGYEIRETRPYRVHQRIVPSYAVGRLVLAGDAAHVNSPSGGMGLNGGLHDAFALARALDAILRNEAGLERLAQYDAERRPVAKDQILAQADRNRARMRERDPERRRQMLDDLIVTTEDRARLKAYLMKSSMIDGLRQAAASLRTG